MWGSSSVIGDAQIRRHSFASRFIIAYVAKCAPVAVSLDAVLNLQQF